MVAYDTAKNQAYFDRMWKMLVAWNVYCVVKLGYPVSGISDHAESYMDEKPLVVKDIPSDTMLLVLEPEDTKTLPFGKYVYDIQITYADGKVDTFITKGRLRLTEEVD